MLSGHCPIFLVKGRGIELWLYLAMATDEGD
jgi:hypothetical protein